MMDVKFFKEAMDHVGLKVLVVDEETNLGMGVSNSEFVEKTSEEAQSPFLPDSNVQYAWDATSIELYKRCPQLYKYKMIDGWTTKEESVHLRWGAEMHLCFKEYEVFKAGGHDHDDIVFQVVKNLLDRTKDWDPDHKHKNKFFLIRSVIKYMDKYREDPAKTIILANGKPAVEVSFMFELDHGPTEGKRYVLCGHLDRVVDFNGEIFFMDYKSTTTTPTEWYWNQFHPNNQMTLYTLACKIIFQTKIKGGIIESAQILMEDARFTRGTTYRTEEELEEWLQDLEHWLERAKDSAERNDWPKNDTACEKYGGCKFREICNKSPSVRQRFLTSSFVKEEPWNPLVPR
jgi:RecB family exonuclease